MLGQPKNVDEGLMDFTASNSNATAVQQPNNRKRNAIIGVSSALLVGSAAVALLLAPSSLVKPDAVEEQSWNLLQEPDALPAELDAWDAEDSSTLLPAHADYSGFLGQEILASQCTPRSLPVEKIEENVCFSADRFLKGRDIDIHSDEFKCTVGPNGYEDPTFPATIQGQLIQKFQETSTRGIAYQVKEASIKNFGLKFMRPTELPADSHYGKYGGANTSLWGSKGVLPDGIVQGGLGDCWFLGALGAVAETPSRIKDLFENSEYPKNGAFGINFWVGGKKQQVVIDDRLATLTDFNGSKDSIWFAQPSPQGAWWVPMMEKAYAKLNVDYDNIVGGGPYKALKSLTGMPIESYNIARVTKGADGLDKLWNIIMEATENNWPMATHTGGWVKPISTYLIPTHVYSVLGGKQLKNPDGSDGPKLVEIRNPHGSSRYNQLGPWGRESDKWTPSFRKQLGFTGTNKYDSSEEQGTFWFPLDLFPKDWQNLTVVRWADYKVSSMEGDTAMWASTDKKYQQQYWTLYNPVVQDIIMACDGLERRMFPIIKGQNSRDCDAVPATIGFDIYSKYEYMGQTTKYQKDSRDANCRGGQKTLKSLPVGEYTVRAMNWSSSKGKTTSFFWRAMADKEAVKLGESRPGMEYPAEIQACKDDVRKCNKKICDDDKYKSFDTCKEWLPHDVQQCKFDVKNCNKKICDNSDYKNFDTCKKFSAIPVKVYPAYVQACKDDVMKCNQQICYKNAEYYKFPTCQVLSQCISCYRNTKDCTYAACQSGKYFRYLGGCQDSFKAKNPSAKQFLDPEDVQKCKENWDDCTPKICENSEFKNFDTCKEGARREQERKEAAIKAAAEKKAAAKRAAEKKAREQAIADEKAYKDMQGTGHWIFNGMCIQLNGSKVGNKGIDAGVYERLFKGQQPKLYKGLCMFAGYSERTKYFADEDKLTVSTYIMSAEDKAAEAKAAAAPKSICDGGFAGMDGVGNWNYQTPHSANVEACLERCATRSDCKFIKYNHQNNNCYALKNHVGRCYKNDREKIYPALTASQAAAADAAKAKAHAKAAAKGPVSLCNGGFAGMDGVGNWNYQTPPSANLEDCLDRCATRSDCKFIKYNYKNNNCYALKNHVGQCYPNDKERIYAAKAK